MFIYTYIYIYMYICMYRYIYIYVCIHTFWTRRTSRACRPPLGEGWDPTPNSRH